MATAGGIALVVLPAAQNGPQNQKESNTATNVKDMREGLSLFMRSVR